MMRVLLVRHGQTEWNVRERVQGRADVPLTARGRREGSELRERLSAYPIDAVVASPLSRARDTADLICEGRRIAPAVDCGLAEVDYGAWQGTTASERHRSDARQARMWERARPDVAFPGGESFRQFRARVLAVWRALLERHSRGTTLVVAHGHVNRIILLEVTGRPLDSFWDIDQPNGAVTVVDVDDSRVMACPT